MGLGAGQIVLDTDLAAIIAASSNKPVCRVVANATQSIPDAVITSIAFAAEDMDSHGMHSTVTNNERVTPTVAGIYRVRGTVYLPGRVDYSNMNATIRKNGATMLSPSDRKANLVNAQAVSLTAEVLVDMNGTTDYVELTVFQDNTANTASSTNASGTFTSVMEVEYVRATI